MGARVVFLILLVCAAGGIPLRAAVAAFEKPTFSQSGIASWYGQDRQGKRTANGERFDMRAMTAAHRTLRFDTIARVTRVDNGKTVKVRINDRGPHVRGRVIDLSPAAKSALGMTDKTMTRVRIEVFASDQPR